MPAFLFSQYKGIKIMKKIISVLLICLVASAAVFAGIFEFNIGAVAMYNKPYTELQNYEEIKTNDFSFGAGLDVKIALFGADATALYSKVEDEHVLNGVISLNLPLTIGPVRVALGIGYDYIYNLTTKEYSFGGQTDIQNFLDAYLLARAEVDAILGKLHIGVFGTCPTGLTLRTYEGAKDLDWQSLINSISVGASIKFNFV